MNNVNDKGLNGMTPARAIEYAIQFFANKLGLKAPVFAEGTIVSVDEAERTCVVKITLGDLPEQLEDVHLMASNGDGFLKIPAIDSQVQIRMMPDNEAYVDKFSDLDAVVCFIDDQNEFRFDKNGQIWNKGLNGGFIKIDAQTLKLNQLVLQLQIELSAISAGIASAGGSYAPGILSTFVKTDYENTSLKH